MKKINYFLSIILSIVLLSSGVIYSIPNVAAVAKISIISDDDGSIQIDGGSPYYESLLNNIQLRVDKGIPSPEIILYDTESSFSNDGQLKVTSTLTLKYTDPNQISQGKSEWDRIIVEAHPDYDPGEIIPGDYTQKIIDANPKVFDPAYGGVPWGQHEEMIQYVEEITYDVPRRTVVSGSGQMAMLPNSSPPIGSIQVNAQDMQNVPLSSNIMTENILMGFTLDPTPIDWSIHVKKSACVPYTNICTEIFESRAGFFFDYALGLRLPASVTLITPKEITYPNEETFSVTLTPLDFTEEQYEEMGIPAFDGNELIAQLEFFAGFWVDILNTRVIDKSIDANIDIIKKCDCGNIVTPIGFDEFGQEREFPLKSVEYTPDETGLMFKWTGASLGLGLRLDPLFSSNSITADWDMVGQGQGSGQLRFTDSDLTASDVGPISMMTPQINAENNSPVNPFELQVMTDIASDIDITPSAELQTSNYKFHFDQMLLKLQGKFVPGGWLGFLPDTDYFDIVKIDLAGLFGDVVLGQHIGTDGVDTQIRIGEPDPSSALVSSDSTMVTLGGNPFGAEPSMGSFEIAEMADSVLSISIGDSSQNTDIIDEDARNMIRESWTEVGLPALGDNLAGLSRFMQDNPSETPSRQGTEKLIGMMIKMPEGTSSEIFEKMTKKIKTLENQEASNDTIVQFTEKLEKGMLSSIEIKSASQKELDKRIQKGMIIQQSLTGNMSIFMPKIFEPPYRLFELGLSSDQIICNYGLIPILKISNNLPICVSPDTSEKLIQRDVAEPILE